MRRAWILAFLLSTACDDDVRRPPPPIPTGCESTTICPQSLTCVEGACVGEVTPAWAFRVRFRPADPQLAEVELFDEARFVDGPVRRFDRPIPLPRRVDVIGTATREGEVQAVRASVRALDGIGAQPLAWSSEPVDLGDDTARFLLGLPAWWPVEGGGARATRYGVQVRADSIPPFATERRFGPGTDRFTVELPEGELVPLEGEVRVSPGNPVPLRGVRVTAVDEAGNRVSTVATTDENGAFVVELWPSMQARMLALRVSEGEDPLPDVSQMVEVPAAEPAPFTVVHIGDTGQVLSVAGQLEAPEAAIAARLDFDGQVGNGRFRRSVTTDETGAFTVDLYPGSYDVDVVPADAGEVRYRTSRVTVEVSEGGALSIPLKPRLELTGQVLDPTGAPVPQAVVESELVRAVYGDPGQEIFDETPPARSDTAETNEEGRFLLLLDRGVHRLRISPPALSGLPAIETTAEVKSGVLAGEQLYEIPPAAAVVMSLVDESQAKLQGVVVEVWRTDVEPPVRVGRSTSDAEGKVTVPVPAGAGAGPEPDAGVE